MNISLANLDVITKQKTSIIFEVITCIKKVIACKSKYIIKGTQQIYIKIDHSNICYFKQFQHPSKFCVSYIFCVEICNFFCVFSTFSSIYVVFLTNQSFIYFVFFYESPYLNKQRKTKTRLFIFKHSQKKTKQIAKRNI